MSKLVQLVEEFIKVAHSGAMRWDKKTPYYTHPIAVANLAADRLNEFQPNTSNLELLVRIVALCHDVAEDCTAYANNEELVLDKIKALNVSCNELSSDDYYIILKGLRCMNKNRHKNYLAFVLACKADGIGRYVKWADITHNLDGLVKGSMAEKYLLAKHILEN